MRRMELQAFIFLLIIGSAVTQNTQICPLDCECYLDNKGRITVDCKQGGMTNAELFTNISTDIEILKISAPEDNMNVLSMSPNIQNFLKLEEIHIIRSNIPNLGEHFFYALKKLEILNLAQNNIIQLLPINFSGLKRLRELYLDDNRIYSMPSETFRYLPELKVLSIQRNRIKELMLGVFRGLSKLKVLKLNGNFIQDLNSNIFKDITDLRILECRGCLLKRINPEVNLHLTSLTHLDFTENRIKEISTESFQHLYKLKILKLDGNEITRIPAVLMHNHTELRKISLARNKISKIDAVAFENLENFTDLDLGYNKIKHLPADLFEPIEDSLERLVLSGNKMHLNQIKDAVRNLNIKDLQLADLDLMEVEENFIPNTVIYLNLSANHLSYLPSIILPNNLKELDLSKNLFRGMESDLLDKIERVKCFLEDNPWSCDLCHIIPMLERVNRSSNIYNVRCAKPYHHANKILGNMQRDELSWCSVASYSSEGANFFSTRDDTRLGLIAATASILLLVLTVFAIIAALCYSKRHAAKYYTHEEKRFDETESIFENPSPVFGEELNFKFPLDLNEKKISVSTIDEIRKEHAITNGT